MITLSGSACSSATIKTELADGEGCDSESYSEIAYVVGDCFDYGITDITGQAECEDGTVTLYTYYEDASCSGNPVNGSEAVLFATDGCMTVTCGGGAGSAANKVAAFTAFAIMAIAALAF